MSDRWEEDKRVLRRFGSIPAQRYLENEPLMRPMEPGQLRRPENTVFSGVPGYGQERATRWEEPGQQRTPNNDTRGYVSEREVAPPVGYGFYPPTGERQGVCGAPPAWPAYPEAYAYPPPYGAPPPQQGMPIYPPPYPYGYPAYAQMPVPPGTPVYNPPQGVPYQGQHGVSSPSFAPPGGAATVEERPAMGNRPVMPSPPTIQGQAKAPAASQALEEVPMQAVLQSFPPASIPVTPASEHSPGIAEAKVDSAANMDADELSEDWAWDEWAEESEEENSDSQRQGTAATEAYSGNRGDSNQTFFSDRNREEDHLRKAPIAKAVPVAQAIPVEDSGAAFAQTVPVAKAYPAYPSRIGNALPSDQPDRALAPKDKSYAEANAAADEEPAALPPMMPMHPTEVENGDMEEDMDDEDFGGTEDMPDTPAPAPVPMKTPTIAEEKGHSGLVVVLLVITLLVSLGVVYFSGVLDQTLSQIGIPVWQELSAMLNPPPENSEIPQVFREMTQDTDQGDTQSEGVVSAGESGAPKITGMTVTPPTATAPQAMRFTLQSNTAVQNIQLKNGKQELLPLIDVQSTLSGDGKIWECTVQFDEPYQGVVYAYVLSADDKWVRSGYSCQVDIQ